MDLAGWISFIGQNKVGLHVDVEGSRVLEVKPNGETVDVEILDIEGLKKIRKELKKWRA